MKKNSYSIALVDFSCDDTSIFKALVENRSQVNLLDKRDSYADMLEDLDPDLVLYRSSSYDTIEEIRVVIRNLMKDKGLPLILVPENADITLYLSAIEEGVTHFIQTPCSDVFLIKRIEEVLSAVKRTDDREAGSIELGLNERTYVFRYNQERLSRVLFSLLENNNHQNRILNIMMASKYGFDKMECQGIFHDEDILTDAEKVFEKKLFDAYTNGEMQLHYQPVISIADEKLVGFESLIRWEDPESGLVAPGLFIPTIEKSSLILPLGYWIVEEAALQLQRWKDSYKNNSLFRLSINLSASQFVHDQLCETIFEIVGRHELNPENFALEITESALMENMENANIMLLKFKSMNFPIYMDDFGTGYSSLSYLQHFPVDTIKIDKSFVEWMHIDEQSEQIVRTIIALAHNLKKSVVAEGVEEKEHFTMLKELGCDYGQGYYFSEPLPADRAGEFLRR